MEISLYFEPVNLSKIDFDIEKTNNQIGNQIISLTESYQDDQLATLDAVIIGINEGRNSPDNKECAQAPDEIRKYLYRLFQGNKKIHIGDLGNIAAGNKISDTYFALKSTVTRLLQANVIPILIGGGHDLTFPVYLGFEALSRVINIVSIDARFDNCRDDETAACFSYLSDIIYRKPNFLFNFSNIGYQTYFTHQSEIDLLNKLFFDTYRLGEVREAIEEMEPVIRNADFLTFDISAVRQSDAPANRNASPNGFLGEEACQLIRYAGLSSKLACIGFFETNPSLDQRGQTSQLVAQMIWYFLEGLTNRVPDFPGKNPDDFIKYTVNTSAPDPDLVFFKSKLTNRWWMQLPVSQQKEKNLYRHIMVPCSYNDYTKACHNEIPDRWWKAYQKLM